MLIDFNLFAPETIIFDQFPGVRFPGLPRIIQPTLGNAVGGLALSNSKIGGEINDSPLTIEFSVPQKFVRLAAGLDVESVLPIEATLSAFDAAGIVVAQTGSIPIGPGPTPINTVLTVTTPDSIIKSIQLLYSRSFTEVIDNLEFDAAGTVEPPDSQPPIVIIQQPLEGATLSGETFVLEANITEDRRLRSVRLVISNSSGTVTRDISFLGSPPNYRISSANTGDLALGLNVITIRAEDFGGNLGEASRSITRVPIAGRLVVSPSPILIPRRTAVPVSVDLEAVPPGSGSLNGRKEILIQASISTTVIATGRILEEPNQPLPHVELELASPASQPLGKTEITFEATEVSSGLVIDTVNIPASIALNISFDCQGGVATLIPLFYEIPLLRLTADINTGVDEQLAPLGLDGLRVPREDLQKLEDMTVAYGFGVLKVAQRYKAVGLLGISAPINFSAELRPLVPDGVPREVAFDYVIYEVHAEPKRPSSGWLLIPGINYLLLAVWQVLKRRFESGFTAEFKESFRAGLGKGVTDGVRDEDPRTLTFLTGAVINPSEFVLIFCVSPETLNQIENSG